MKKGFEMSSKHPVILAEALECYKCKERINAEDVLLEVVGIVCSCKNVRVHKITEDWAVAFIKNYMRQDWDFGVDCSKRTVRNKIRLPQEEEMVRQTLSLDTGDDDDDHQGKWVG